jgi:hypothetical protein
VTDNRFSDQSRMGSVGNVPQGVQRRPTEAPRSVYADSVRREALNFAIATNQPKGEKDMQSTPLNTAVPRWVSTRMQFRVLQQHAPQGARRSTGSGRQGPQEPRERCCRRRSRYGAEARTTAVEHADATAAWVGNTVRARPLSTLGLAVAIGAVIGLLIARR